MAAVRTLVSMETLAYICFNKTLFSTKPNGTFILAQIRFKNKSNNLDIQSPNITFFNFVACQWSKILA